MTAAFHHFSVKIYPPIHREPCFACFRKPRKQVNSTAANRARHPFVRKSIRECKMREASEHIRGNFAGILRITRPPLHRVFPKLGLLAFAHPFARAASALPQQTCPTRWTPFFQSQLVEKKNDYCSALLFTSWGRGKRGKGAGTKNAYLFAGSRVFLLCRKKCKIT